MKPSTILFAWILLGSISTGFPTNGFAQSVVNVSDVGSASYEYQLENAIESFYQADWDDTRRILSELQLSNRNDLRLQFFEAMIPFWSYFFGGNNPSDADKFLQQSATAIEMGDRILAASPQDTSVILLMGGLHGYRSLVAASERKYRTAISSGITGYSFTKVLLQMDDDDPNTLMGQGVFEYMMGSVPREARWITRLAGISGNMQEGFDILERAAASSGYIRNDAAMFLAYFYEQQGQLDQARRHLQNLADRYPDNIIFTYNLARILEMQGSTAQAMELYEQVASVVQTPLANLPVRSADRLETLRENR